MVLVKETHGQLVRSFFAKTLGDVPRDGFDFESKPKINLAELFVYQLFKIIGVGALEVHIIPDTTHSECVYLATQTSKNYDFKLGI